MELNENEGNEEGGGDDYRDPEDFWKGEAEKEEAEGGCLEGLVASKYCERGAYEDDGS